MALALHLLYALLMVLLPTAEAIYHERSPAALLFLFWVESMMLLLTHPARIVMHRYLTRATGHYATMNQISAMRSVASLPSLLATPNTFLKSFLGLTAAFTLVHGVFIALIVFVFKISGPFVWRDMQIAIYWAVVMQLGFLLIDVFTLSRWPFFRLHVTVASSVRRLLVTQFGIIFGVLMAAITKSPWALVGTFIAFRVIIDGFLEWSVSAHRRGRISDRFARAIAKKENKSVEQVREDLRQSSKDEREAYELFNKPISEVRPDLA